MRSPPDVTGTAAAANGDGVDTGEAEADGDGDGDGGDDDEPISFEAWKEQREKAAKEAQERREKEEKEAKERAAEERRRARKAEKIELKDEADLEGLPKGLQDPRRRLEDVLLRPVARDRRDDEGAPRRAEGAEAALGGRRRGAAAAGAAAAGGETSRQEGGSGSGTAGSAWNNGTTWEEKDCSAWAKEALEGRLKGLTAAAAAAAGGWVAKSSKVKEVEGAASVVATRGALRHVFEYAFDLEYRLSGAAADEPAAGEDADADTAEGDGKATPKAPAAIKGTLHYTDVSSSSKSGVVVGGVTNAFKGSPDDEAAALAAVEALKARVVAAVEQLDVEFRATKRI